MHHIELIPLSKIDVAHLVALMNDPKVGAHLPLLAGRFSTEDSRVFLAAKQQMWDEHGYGPWAFRIEGRFAGWGGLQPENGQADFALVLHPDFWGWGRRVFERIKQEAFGPMNLESMTILLPPSRRHARAVTRLGFVADGEAVVGGEVFARFRLTRR